ncbi:MAG: FapA family protein [bacterium]
MEQLFAVKKDETVFKFFLDTDKQLVGIVSGKPSNIPPKALLRFLIKKGVVQKCVNAAGIRKLASAALSLSPSGDDEERSVVAVPEHPVNHDPLEISFRENPDRTPSCSIGEVIGSIDNVKNGSPGVDIFGEIIYPPEQDISVLSRIDNITAKIEERTLISESDGHLVKTGDDSYAVFEKINIFFDTDKMTAYAALCTSEEVTPAEINRFLSENDVTYGIDSNAVNLLAMRTKEIDSLVTTKKVPVARGKKFIETVPGYIDWKVNPEKEIAFEEDEHGNINYKEVNIITSVKKGTVIAELHHPREGKQGVTVTGETLNPQPPKPVRLFSGKGVSNEEKATVFVSETEGIVSCDGDTLSVLPLYKIEGDVDYETGNVSFEGSIEVKNDVLPGFDVSAEQGITVGGTAEGANIHAEDSIHVKGGIPGKEKGKVSAKKDIIARYVSECSVTTGNNLIVTSSITDSKIICYGSVICTAGTIVGGKILSNRGIICKDIGSDIGVKTNITVGGSDIKYKKFKTLKVEYLELKQRLEDMERKKSSVNDDDYDKKRALESYCSSLEKQISEKENEIKKLSGGYNLPEPAFKIAVLGTVHPGTIINMKKNIMNVKRPLKGPVLIYYNNAKEEIDIRHLVKNEIAIIKKDFSKWLQKSEGNLE